jgi:tetratricopeptide (TPR) repeat protein
MENQRLENDVDLLKHESYIKNNPDSPTGYMSLAGLYMKYSLYKSARKTYMKAYHMDSRYLSGIIGASIADIMMGRHIRAIKSIEKIKQDLEEKSALRYKLIRGVSSLYETIKTGKDFIANSRIKRLSSPFIRNFSGINKNNPLYIYLICIGIAANKFGKVSKDEDIKNFKTFVYEKGLSPELRYRIINILSNTDPKIRKDTKLAKLFYKTSENMDTEYSNFVFGTVLDSFDYHHVKSIYKSMSNHGKPIENKNLWKFVYMSKNYACMDISTANSCVRLLKNGWIDKTIIDSMKKINEKELSKYKLFL